MCGRIFGEVLKGKSIDWITFMLCTKGRWFLNRWFCKWVMMNENAWVDCYFMDEHKW